MFKILALVVSMFHHQPVAQVRPCVWPNTCKAPVVEVVQFTTCVWPHRCSKPA